MKKNFCWIRAFLRLLLFYISFCSLFINTHLVFISYFDSFPLRKGYRGLECKCLFYRLHLFLLHFRWFALLSLLVLWFSCLHFWLFKLQLLDFHQLFHNITGTFGFRRLFCNTSIDKIFFLEGRLGTRLYDDD